MDRETVRFSCLSILIVGLLANWAFLLVAHDSYLSILGQIFSSDGIILHPEKAILKLQIALASAIFFCFIATSKTSTELLLKTSTGNKAIYFAILVLICIHQFPRLPTAVMINEDGFFEWMTAIFALTTALLLFAKAWLSRLHSGWLLTIILSLLFFLFGMEEISWGQRIWGWGTPEQWADINAQQETNLHNVFQDYLVFVYPIFNLILGSSILYVTGSSNLPAFIQQYGNLFPSRELRLYGYIFLAFIIHSYFFHGELTEEVFSIFGLTYALEQWRAPDRLGKPAEHSMS